MVEDQASVDLVGKTFRKNAPMNGSYETGQVVTVVHVEPIKACNGKYADDFITVRWTTKGFDTVRVETVRRWYLDAHFTEVPPVWEVGKTYAPKNSAIGVVYTVDYVGPKGDAYAHRTDEGGLRRADRDFHGYGISAYERGDYEEVEATDG